MILRRLVALLILATIGSVAPIATDAAAQTNPFQTLAHRIYDQESGLPETLISSVARTPDGYLWLGTRRGLVRFDGSRFRLFTPDDTPALRSSYISRLATDGSNRLWIGTAGGLAVLEKGAFRAVGTEAGFGSWPIEAVFADRSGAVWVSTDSVMLRSAGGRFEVVADHPVAAFAEDRGGRIWVGTDEGLFRVDGGRLVAAPGSPDRSLGAVTALATDAAGALWAGVRGGVRRIEIGDDGRATAGPLVSIAEDALPPLVSSLAVDRAGRVWIGSPTHGLAIWDGRQVSRFGFEQSLSSLEINALLVDPWDRVWAGSGAALDLFQPTAFTSYSYAEGFPRSLIWSVDGTPDGRMVATAENGGVYRFDGRTLTTLVPPKAPDAGPRPFAITPSGAVLVVDGRRIVRHDRGGATDLTGRVGLPPTAIRRIYATRDSSVWFATDSGVFRWRHDRLERFGEQVGLGSERLRIVAMDSAGTTWLARPNLYRVGDRVTRIGRAEGLTDSLIETLYPRGADLWIGTSDSGLFVHRPGGRVVSFGRLDRRLRTEVLGIIEDDAGYLWLTSSYGLKRIRKADLLAVADGRSMPLEVREFDRQDGLPTTEFNGFSQSAAFKDAAGHLWLPSYVGLVRVDPERVAADTGAPKLLIDRVLVDGRELPSGGPISLPPGVGRLAIDFTVTNVRFPGRAVVQYRLEGLEDGWTDAGPRRVILYGPLAGGRYRFLLRALGSDGAWRPVDASVELAVALRFHEHPWFIPVLVLMVSGLAAVGYRFRIRQVRHRAEELATLVETRTRDLEIARANLERRVEERTSQLAEELAERKRLQHQLLQAQKLESIGRLAGGVAHEINNMMTGVLGFAEMAEAQAKDHPGIRDDLRQISVAGQRVAQITRQLLTFARRQASKRASIDLGALVRSLEPFLLRVVGENVRLSVSVADGVPRINADASQIEQLIVNLVMNARDAVTGQGTIQIELASTVVDEVRQIGTFEILPGDYVRLAVVDSGVGISAEARSRLFEPFFTTKDVNRGTGLGLSVCYGIVTQHAGAIAVESEVGRGSRFEVFLPTGVVADESTGSSGEHRVPGGVERILVVEDEAAVRAVATRTLEHLGYEVVAVADGLAALEKFRADPDRVDLVLTDVVMPRMGGVELAQALREERPDLPLVFMSGYTGRETPWNGNIAELGPMLEKPFTRAGLAGAIRKVLDQPRGAATPPVR